MVVRHYLTAAALPYSAAGWCRLRGKRGDLRRRKAFGGGLHPQKLLQADGEGRRPGGGAADTGFARAPACGGRPAALPIGLQ